MKNIREVRILHLLTYLLIPCALLISGVIGALYILQTEMPGYLKIVLILALAVAEYYITKRFCIGLVLAYKAFAPMSIRSRCRYEPTCSTYMIMAINKYGLFIGVYKGIRRIRRCRPPNGGVDYP